MDLDTLQWFEAQKHPDALPLYEALEGRILAEIPGVRIKVQKSQISFYTKHLFGCVSYLRARKKAQLPPCYLVVTVGLAGEIDGELMDWIREAAAFAAAK